MDLQTLNYSVSHWKAILSPSQLFKVQNTLAPVDIRAIGRIIGAVSSYLMDLFTPNIWSTGATVDREEQAKKEKSSTFMACTQRHMPLAAPDTLPTDSGVNSLLEVNLESFFIIASSKVSLLNPISFSMKPASPNAFLASSQLGARFSAVITAAENARLGHGHVETHFKNSFVQQGQF